MKQVILFLLLLTTLNSQELTKISFEPASQTFEFCRTNSIAIGDIDGDNDLDMIWANMGLNHSRVLFNNGSGTFEFGNQELTMQGHGVALYDLDNDNDLDLFITCAGWTQEDIEYNRPTKVYLNNGEGYFNESNISLKDSLLSGTGLELVDYNTDGNMDIAISYYPDENYVYLRDESGGYGNNKLVVEENAYFFDFNSDDKPDKFIVSDKEGYHLLLNKGNGNFINTFTLDDTTTERGNISFIDIENDGDIDIIHSMGNIRESGVTRILLNSGNNHFQISDVKLPSLHAGRIGVYDLNNDRYDDLVLTDARNETQIWINNKNGSFSDSGMRLPNKGFLSSVSFADLDNDGDADIVLSGFFMGEPNQIWINKFN